MLFYTQQSKRVLFQHPHPHDRERIIFLSFLFSQRPPPPSLSHTHTYSLKTYTHEPLPLSFIPILHVPQRNSHTLIPCARAYKKHAGHCEREAVYFANRLLLLLPLASPFFKAFSLLRLFPPPPLPILKHVRSPSPAPQTATPGRAGLETRV